MAKRLVCDICRKETNKIVGKLHFIPQTENGLTHSNYTHHADVGECCGTKILSVFNFRKRMTRKEYMASRKV